MRSYRDKHPGFTLTEILIALVLVGTIVSFTVPQIISTVERQQSQSRVRSFISAIQGAYYGLRMRQTLEERDNYLDNIATRMNALRWQGGAIPPNGANDVPLSTTHACRGGAGDATHDATPPGFSTNEAPGWMLMKNSVVVTGLIGRAETDTLLEQGTTRRLVICMDTNSDAGPNRLGRDIFFFNAYHTLSGMAFCFGQSGGAGCTVTSWNGGALTITANANAASVLMP